MSSSYSFKEIVDLSVPLKSMDTPVYPGYPQPLRTDFTTLREDGYHSCVWTFVEHTSTHVDAPSHMVADGAPVDQMPLSKYVGQGVVLDFSKAPPMYGITRDDVLKGLSAQGIDDVGRGWIVLFRTDYSSKDRTPHWLEHPGLTRDASEFLAQKGVNAVGFDAPGPDHAPFDAHNLLLPTGVVIFENLANLDRITGKRFLFVGTPLKLVGGTASPCRPVALVA